MAGYKDVLSNTDKTIRAVALSVLLVVTSANHNIEKYEQTPEGKEVTWLSNVRWQPEVIPRHVVVEEPEMDMAYEILESHAIKPCDKQNTRCPEVIRVDQELYFFWFSENPTEPGYVYITRDVPNLYRVNDKEWHWYQMEVNK